MPNNRVVSAFLEKTFKLLSVPESNGIIDWSKDGKTFVVKRPRDFSEIILPKYFRHSKFSSFVRQLNFYGFHKLRTDDTGLLSSGRIDQTAETGWWEFQHQYFQRGKHELLCKIKRKTYTDEEKSEVVKLRSDLDDLRDQVAELQKSVSSLTELISKTHGKPSTSRQENRSSSKKRKLESVQPASSSQASSSMLQDTILPTDLDYDFNALDYDLFQLFENPSSSNLTHTPAPAHLPPLDSGIKPEALPKVQSPRSQAKRTKIESEIELCDIRLKQNPDDLATESYKALLLEHLRPLL